MSNEKMDRDKLLSTLREIKDSAALNFDREEGHISADNALLDYIDDPEIAEAFDEIPKWYA